MKLRLINTVSVLILIAVSAVGQSAYFPQRAFDKNAQSDQFVNNWYSGQLKALQEPSLFWLSSTEPRAQSYRFLWLRTFHHPIAVRLDVQPDGTGILVTKIASGLGGYNPGSLTENRSTTLTTEQTKAFLSKIDQSQFWSLPSYNKVAGADGSEWVIEAVKAGKYHVVSRWSPQSGPIYTLGSTLAFELAKITVPKDQLY